MGWEDSAARAKRLHRPSLKNWERDGLVDSFPSYARSLLSGENCHYSYFGIRVGEESGNGDNNNNSRRGVVEELSLSLDEARGLGEDDIMGGKNAGGGYSLYHINLLQHGHDRPKKRRMIPVVLDANHLSPSKFHERYESRRIPCVIRGIPYGESLFTEDIRSEERIRMSTNIDYELDGEEKKECRRDDDTRQIFRRDGYDDIDSFSATASNLPAKEWPAVCSWSISSLLSDPILCNAKFKCGEDDDGHTIRMRLCHFLEYLQHNKDDSPLYIFDATFDECKRAKRLLSDYSVPSYFKEDLFGLVGKRRRPPYRWFLVGPARSGTTIHIDPLNTSAWNTLIHGVKRWVLFPPHLPKDVVRGRGLVLKGEDDEAVHYFTVILPRIKRKAAALAMNVTMTIDIDKDPYTNFECYEFTQFPGDTVYIPHGWWHAVLNVSDTLGITQNYCSRRNFDDVWRATRSGRKKMACSWLRKLDEKCPDLARRARELNNTDRYIMWSDDVEEQRRYRKKKERREQKRMKTKKKSSSDGKENPREQLTSKKEKWGEHRTTKKEDTLLDG